MTIQHLFMWQTRAKIKSWETSLVACKINFCTSIIYTVCYISQRNIWTFSIWGDLYKQSENIGETSHTFNIIKYSLAITLLETKYFQVKLFCNQVLSSGIPYFISIKANFLIPSWITNQITCTLNVQFSWSVLVALLRLSYQSFDSYLYLRRHNFLLFEMLNSNFSLSLCDAFLSYKTPMSRCRYYMHLKLRNICIYI